MPYYYKCPRCGFVTFILSRIACVNCGCPFIVVDKHAFYLKNQSRLEDFIPWVKK